MTAPNNLGDPLLLSLRVNGEEREVTVDSRRSLADALRHDLGLTGTHIACEHGVCGACTVLVDEEPVRSCLMLAAQAEGHRVRTVEDLGTPDALNDIQEAFTKNHALQCGFCTPGFLMLLEGTLDDVAEADLGGDEREEVREIVASNLCRCTGYEPIVNAACEVARERRLAMRGTTSDDKEFNDEDRQ